MSPGGPARRAGGSAPLPVTVTEASEGFRHDYGAKLRDAMQAANTSRAYAADQRHFQSWCAAVGAQPLPAGEETIIAYLLYFGDPATARRDGDALLKPATLARRVAGVKAWHASEQAPWPRYYDGETNLITRTLDYIARQQKAGPVKARALSPAKLHAAVARLPVDPRGLRNRAILLTGFYGAMRRAEITGLDLADLSFSDGDGGDDEGMVLVLRHSKTDQKALGRAISVNYLGHAHCPVIAVKQWLAVRGDAPGPLFTNLDRLGPGGVTRLAPRRVNLILKDALAAIGESATTYSAHSLRSGFVTTAAKLGVPARLIKHQTGHASYEMLDRYIHDSGTLSDNATKYMR